MITCFFCISGIPFFGPRLLFLVSISSHHVCMISFHHFMSMLSCSDVCMSSWFWCFLSPCHHICTITYLHIYISKCLHSIIVSSFRLLIFSYEPVLGARNQMLRMPPTLLCIFVFPRRIFCNHLTTFLCPHVFIP